MRTTRISCVLLAAWCAAIAAGGGVRAHASGAPAAPARQAGEPEKKDWELLFPEGEGKSYVLALCQPCHDLKTTALARHDAKGWRGVVGGMNSRGANLDKEDIAIMVEYLAEHFGADRPPLELPIDVNQADAALLSLLPQLTSDEAGTLIAARTKKPFRDIADLKAVLSNDKIAQLTPFIVVR